MKINNLQNLNTEALAYMGDAVYEKYIREMLLLRGFAKANNLHKAATRYVKAHAQAQVIRELFDELTEKEQSLVKRARNHRYSSKAKNADPITYKWATGFEALIGYLYLADEDERLKHIMERAVEIIG